MQTRAILEPKFTTHYLEYDNMKFFRENAFAVEAGSFGEKKDPIGARAYLDVHGRVKPETVSKYLKYKTAVSVNWSEVSEKVIGANGYLPVFGMDGKAAATFTFTRAKAEKVKLITFQIDNNPLERMLNNDAPAARRYLAEEGADGRICSGVWIWAEAEVAEHFSNSSLITASLDSGSAGIAIMAKGGKLGTHIVTIAAGTTCAYRLHKVKRWTNNDRTAVEEMETDYKGNG